MLLSALFWYRIFNCSNNCILLGALPDSPFISVIPPEKWYLVQAFTTIPLTFIAHSIYSATAYLLSRLMKGKGSFDATFSSQAFTVYIPTLIFMCLPELTYFTYLNSKGIYEYPGLILLNT